jgi:hypothetical protein
MRGLFLTRKHYPFVAPKRVVTGFLFRFNTDVRPAVEPKQANARRSGYGRRKSKGL